MQEKWKPLYEIEDNGIYHKRDKFLLVSKKEFTLQDEKTILKRKRMKEKEPKKEELICSGCGQPIDQNDYKTGWLRSQGHAYHYDHFKPRPRWQLKDEDEGVTIYKKGKKEMNIIEIKHIGEIVRDVIIFEPDNKDKTMLIKRIKNK